MLIPVLFIAIAFAGVQLEPGSAAVSVMAGGDWVVSLSLLNRGDVAAKDVEVSAVTLGGAQLVTPLPIRVGEISDVRAGTVKVRFSRAASGVMKLSGTYGEGGRRYPFSLSYSVSPVSEPPGFAAANGGPALVVPSGDLIPVQVKGLWGYARPQTPGEFVIRPQFTHALPFSEGLAAVAVRDKWGYIDAAGVFRIPAQFDAATPFAGGVARVTVGKETRSIDATGAFVH